MTGKAGKSEKDLIEGEVQVALEAIKDISKHWLSRSFSIENDWNMRLKALTRIQQIVLQISQ